MQVFFKKDDISPYTQSYPLYADPVTLVPYIVDVSNWFHYWKQIIPTTMRSVPGIALFDPSTCTFNSGVTGFSLEILYGKFGIFTSDYTYNPPPGQNTYGANKYSAAGNHTISIGPAGTHCNSYPISTSVVVSYEPLFQHMLIGEACGFQKTDPRSASSIIEGLHVFLSTVTHEVEHSKIDCEVWSGGYSKHLDIEPDGYNDIWEASIAMGGIYLFSVGTDDSYQPDYVYDPITNTYTTASGAPVRVGTVYEETRCRNEEKSFLNTMHSSGYPFDDEDWSFDPTRTHQGKQYKP